jgi:hypothetical protein
MSTTTHQVKIEVAIQFGKLQSVLDWCNQNCNAAWHYRESPFFWISSSFAPANYNYTFYFDSHKDSVAFLLVHG